jgi:tetratricopeptide (TPR) repeat protein
MNQKESSMKPHLPEAVTVRVEPMIIPTFPTLEPEPNPMFFETRNIQGSRGNIYPHPFIDRISSQKVDREYQAVILENEYLYLVLLPELGGRIFIGQDKTNGYDFFYRHQVIKPALIGTFGPWISGGLEFNWPQHHRPTTFDPTDVVIERYRDGSITVWMGEHEPLNRTKGMVGITLYPGKAFVETKVQLFNRTPFPQTFLWWANAAVPINQQYQVIFPPDVHYALYHAKNPAIDYPIGKGTYLSGDAGANDYGEGTDISYWAHSSGATSFFAVESQYDFFGGYDHQRDCGIVHVADSGISGGKKYFTWANGPYGHRWQKNLYDLEEEGEYLELMAGVYTDNQPDFSWIMPYETRTFSQYWLPVQKIGAMKNANHRAAVNLEITGSQVFVGVYATEVLARASVTLKAKDRVLFTETVDLAPGKPFIQTINLPADPLASDLVLGIYGPENEEIIRYQPEVSQDTDRPEPYQPPAAPNEVETIEELFFIGLHLEQYRHPGIAPELYWQEALRRDPEDARSNLFMGKLVLSRGEFAKAEAYFQTTIKRLTRRNFNPYDGEVYYALGLTLQYQGRLDRAYKSFYKATWNYAWQSASFYSLAQIDLSHGNHAKALEHLDRSLAANAHNAKARGLKAAVLRRIGQSDAAEKLASDSIALDPLDFWARYECALSKPNKMPARLQEMKALMRDEPQTYFDIALDYLMAGLDEEAAGLLDIAAGFNRLHPMIAYTLSFLARRSGNTSLARDWQQQGANASPDYCFPWRLEEMIILQQALQDNPEDAHASYYLGNLLYDKKRYAEASTLWGKASRLEPGFSIPWRNLGLAAYNVDKDLDQALRYLEQAVIANPNDPRLMLEQDFLLRRKAVPPDERLARYLSRRHVVTKRDDLITELMALYNRTGQPEKALEFCHSRQFHPWEGGEGSVATQYATAHWLMGCSALDSGDPGTALNHFLTGSEPPVQVGELPPASEIVRLVYYSSLAYEKLNERDKAHAAFERVVAMKRTRLEVDYYRGLALLNLSKEEEGRAILSHLKSCALERAEIGVKPNYFFYGNPNPTFDEDPKRQQRIYYTLLVGLACIGLGDLAGAKNALNQVLAVDPANVWAFAELKRLKMN